MYLRQSTAATIEAGPLVSSTDGVTEQTALTSQTGRYVVGGTSASLTPASWSHTANGNYAVGLSTTHTGTVGRLKIVFQSSGTYLPVWREYVVLSAAVYDALFGSNALSTHTAANVAALVLATPANLLATDASGNVTLAAATHTGAIIPTVTNLTNAPTSGDFTATMKTSITTAATAATPTVTAGTVSDKTGYSLTAAYDAAKTAAPTAATNAAAVWDLSTAGHTTASTFGAAMVAATAPSASTVAAAVWDLNTTGHTTAGTFGAAMNAAGSAGDPWATSLPGAYGAGSAGYIVGHNLDATVSSRSTYAGADTSGTTTLLSRLTSTRATALDNLDAAITSRMATYAQPTGFLTATFPATVASTTNITAASGVTLAATTHTGAIIPRVTLVDTTTTNTDMRGTNNAMLAASYTAPDNTSITAIKTVTDKLNTTLQTDGGTGYQFTVLSLANAPSGTGGGLTLSGLQGELDTRGLTGTLTTTISTNLDAKVSGRAAPGAAMTLTTAYDAAKTAAPTAATIAVAVRDVNNTSPAASSLGAAVNTASSGGLNQQAVIDGVVSGVAGAGVSLDLTQAVPLSNTANTVGDCLNAARAQGFGKWSKVGANLTLYAADGSTPVRSFVLDDAVSPTSRA